MFRIAVCDDNGIILGCINRAVIEFFKTYQECFDLHSFSNGSLLLSANKEESFDILFLDIQMPDMDGFEIAAEIREHSLNAHIIFITSNDSLVFKALDYQPFHFICKGNGDKIDREVKRVLSMLVEHIKQHSAAAVNLTVAESKGIVIKEIVMIEADGHYLKYHMKNKETLRVRGDIVTVGDTMAKYHFIQIHRSYLVNPQHISRLSLQTDSVILSDGRELHLGRMFKKEAAKKYGDYYSCGSKL